MERRTFLGGVSTVIAVGGCVDVTGSSSNKPTPTRDGMNSSVTYDSDEFELSTEMVESSKESVFAELEIRLDNTSNKTIKVSMGPPSPFGVLKAYGKTVENEILLWNDGYQSEPTILTDGMMLEGWTLHGETFLLHASESTSATYLLSSDVGMVSEGRNSLKSGDYQVKGLKNRPFRINGETVTLSVSI